jgi:superfamily II DNA or RNA helicase
MIQFSYDSKKNVGVIESADPSIVQEIREHFSVKNENAHFMRKFGRFVPPRTYAITPTGRFEPGLFFEIKKFLLKKQYVGDVKISPELSQVIAPATCTWHINPYFTYNPYSLKISLRDYQREIVERGLEIGRGTVVLATAGGKTLTAATLLSNIYNCTTKKFKCLFIVPDRGLVEQTTQDFVDYNVPFSVSKWTGDDKLDLSSDVIVANLGILQSKNTDLKWLEDISVLFVDEVHKIRKGNEINKLFKIIKTPHRFGLTGTMPEGNLDQWNIIGKIGPIIYEKHSKDLRDDNYIAGADIQVIKLLHKNRIINDNINRTNVAENYRREIDTLIKSAFRNNIITKLTTQLNNNSLVLVDYIEHGEILYNLINSSNLNKQVFFIRGEVEVSEREKIRQLIEEHSNVVVVAISKIFSTGINIRNLHYIIFACGGKAKIKIVQSIGRGLRLHKNKSKLIIFDIADNYKYSLAHLEKRLQLYEKEQINFAIKEVQEK